MRSAPRWSRSRSSCSRGGSRPRRWSNSRANLDAQARLRGSGELVKGVELDAVFHTMFPEFLGNQEIIRVVGQLRGKDAAGGDAGVPTVSDTDRGRVTSNTRRSPAL